MEWFGTWGLTLTVFLPLLGALLLGLISKENENALKRTGLAATALAFIASLVLIGQFDFSSSSYNTYQFEVSETWIGAINANYHVGIDGISLPLLVLSTFVMVLCVIYSWNHWEEPKNPKAFLILMMILATGMNGTFVALDLVLFFIFFEIVLLPMYFMIGIWGGQDAEKGSRLRQGVGDQALRRDQVLPVHAFWIGLHASGIPGPLLRVRQVW